MVRPFIAAVFTLHVLAVSQLAALAQQVPNAQADAIRVCADVAGISSLGVLNALQKRYADGITGDCIAARITELRPSAPPSPDASARPSALATFRDCSSCPEMVSLPTGVVQYGSPLTEPNRVSYESIQSPVAVDKAFAIGKFEVTFAEWDACIADKGCVHVPGDEGWGRGKQPVVNVSWDDANAYVAWLSRKTGKPYRLPSEIEWEYAARAGTATPYTTGADLRHAQAKFAHEGPSGPSRAALVGTYAPNAFGLFDVHGNVSEWTADCYAKINAGIKPSGEEIPAPCSRTHRGGSFNDYADSVRSASRVGTAVDLRDATIGFRVARTLEN